MKTMRTKWRGVMGVLLFGGASASVSYAADDPVVLKQTATIVERCDLSTTCKNPGTPPHAHKGLGDDNIEKGAQFHVRKKLFRRKFRYIDLKGVWFDEIQRPDLHLIHKDKALLSSDSIDLSACPDPITLGCIKIKDFPYAFGIRLLENHDKSITPHAFIYVPARQESKTASPRGDSFVLSVLHIPDSDVDCGATHTIFEQRHCQLLRKAAAVWSSDETGPDDLRRKVEQQYRDFLDHLFDGYELRGNGIVPTTAPAGARPITTVNDPKRLTIKDLINFLLAIRLHNDIIHGKLK
jgi:hypothetical protein